MLVYQRVIQLHMLLFKPFFNSHGRWCVKIPWIRPGNLSSQIPGATPGAMKSWIWDVSSIATWWARQPPKRCIWAGFVENWGHFWRIMCSNWLVGMVITIFTSEVKWAIQYLVVWNMFLFFHFIYGMSSFPLTHIFQDGSNHQPVLLCDIWGFSYPQMDGL